MIYTSIITQKGQVTIPSLIRKKIGIATGDKVTFQIENNVIKILPLPSFFTFRGSIKSKKEFNIKKIRKEVRKILTKRYGKNP